MAAVVDCSELEICDTVLRGGWMVGVNLDPVEINFCWNFIELKEELQVADRNLIKSISLASDTSLYALSQLNPSEIFVRDRLFVILGGQIFLRMYFKLSEFQKQILNFNLN